MKASESAREAAADLEAWERDDSKRARFLSGEFDGTFAVQAITQAEARGREATLREVIALLDLCCDPCNVCHEAVAALIPGEPA